MTQTKTITGTVDWSSALTGEALLFGLLGKMLYTNPEKEWLQPLVDEQVFTEAPFAETQADIIEGLKLLETWSQSGQEGLSAAQVDDLKADYTRLFVGVGRMSAAPWESVYYSEERLLFQESTLDVRAWYRRFGLEAVNLYKEPDDHIALELSFMAHLANLGLKALSEEDRPTFEETLAAQRGFLSEHLLPWAPLWCNLVLETAHTDFYRGLALLVRGALHELAALFELKIPEVKKR